MMDFTGWKYYTGQVFAEGKFVSQNIGIISLDGKQSISLQDPEVAKWLADGNTPLPAENS